MISCILGLEKPAGSDRARFLGSVRSRKLGSNLAIACLAALIVMPASATNHDQSLVTVLSFFDGGPKSEVLDRFEPGLLEQLLVIIDDEEVPRLARLRAISALDRYPEDARAFETLSSLATNEALHATIRLEALSALGREPVHEDKTLAVLGSVLSDEDPGLRARAVMAISSIGGLEAERLLSRQRLIERHVVVRRALRGAQGTRLQQPLPPEGRMLPEMSLQPGNNSREQPPVPGKEPEVNR